jgi:GTPase SAR1 family protein
MTSPIERRIKRFLFIGPTGVGKSTLINILFNNNVNKQYLSKPAVTSEGSAGSTACFTTYYNFPNYAFTDSIGFGDNRFDKEKILSMLKATVKNSMVGYNRIYLCLNYGRISSDIRYYIELLIVIFGKKILNWCTIVFTHCRDQKMTKEKYIQSNEHDTYIVGVINSVQNVIFGDNMIDDEIENVLIIRRQRLLDLLNEDIRNSKTDYYSPRPENFTEWLQAIYNMFTSKYAKQVNTCFEEIQKISGAIATLMIHQSFANFYGQCSICLCDMWNTDSVFTKCHHIFHETCIDEWLDHKGNTCPMCRSLLDKKDSFLTSLYFDWECVERNEVV